MLFIRIWSCVYSPTAGAMFLKLHVVAEFKSVESWRLWEIEACYPRPAVTPPKILLDGFIHIDSFIKTES
jgi:hypothetical protein